MRLLTLAVALLMAAATLFYVTARHHRREYRATSIDGRESPIARRMGDRYREPEDGVQPADWPAGWFASGTQGGHAVLPPPWPTWSNSPAWERGEVGWQRPWATGLG